MSCKARQYSDQYYCGWCGLAWDINDPDPPACKPKSDSKMEGRRAFIKIRELLEENEQDTVR